MGKSYVIEGQYKNNKIDYGNTRVWIKCEPYSQTMNKLSVSSDNLLAISLRD